MILKIINMTSLNLDGNLETERTCEGKQLFHEIKMKFSTVVYLNKCLKQIKLPIPLHMCTPIPELPFVYVQWYDQDGINREQDLTTSEVPLELL